MSNTHVSPHGGTLVDRFVSAAEADALRARAAGLPRIQLDAREEADLELIATGAASPLRGFLGSADYRSVLDRLRLADGTVWPLPLTLAVDDAARAGLGVGRPGSDAALWDGAGRLRGVIAVSELYERDPNEESRAVYRTEDASHPGVAYLRSRPRGLVAGEVTALPLPTDLPFAAHRFTPRELRAKIAERGWRRVAGFQTRNPIHRAHEHLTKLALEFADGLVIHPLVGETKGDDVPAAVRFRAYEALVSKYYPPERTLLAAFPAAMRYAGPREALFHALVRKNYGITHLIVGRDHAGVGKFYGPLEAQQIFERFTFEELGVAPLKFDPTFFCRACDALASPRTCPHDASERLELSGSKVREILRAGGELPREFTRPEIAELLRAHYAGNGAAPTEPPKRDSGVPVPRPIPILSQGSDTAPAAAPVTPPVSGAAPGFIVWFTGLSGAGKSTLAEALKKQLAGDRPVEILDGDEVRTHLSKGLGFSREDRDTNIRRIGFVARLLARNGAVALTAAISPYAETREEVRRAAEKDGVAFVEVYARAELDALVARDVKGLYKKALAGEIAHFTGVSDPYEPPASPELEIRSDLEPVAESLERILTKLRERSLIGAAPSTRAQVQESGAAPVYPAFLKFAGRRVLVVGGGPVAAGKVAGLVAAGAEVTVVSPEVRAEIETSGATVQRRAFAPRDLEGAWFVIAAAPPEVNREVAAAAEAQRVFVIAVDDPASASAYGGGVFRRAGVTVAISTDGQAPALAGLLREGLEAVIPNELGAWLEAARGLRRRWKIDGVPFAARRPQLLETLNRLYAGRNPRPTKEESAA